MKRLIAILVVAVLMMLSSCGQALFLNLASSDNNVSQKEVCDYIDGKTDSLKECADRALQSGSPLNNEELVGILGEETIVEGARAEIDGQNRVMVFDCGGSGIGGDSEYSGFYYSENDIPFGIDFAEICTFTETEPDTYCWSEEGGSHSVYTVRLTENWFYFYEIYH